MLESILERVLSTYFGRYISGFDQQNLHIGVWSGNIQIENVGINPTIIDLLELPLNINFSHIGMLQLKIPWSKLSSSPVEVLIDSVFMIVSPKESRDWNIIDKNSFERKLKNINEFSKQYFEQIATKNQLKTTTQQHNSTFIDKLITKIVDNLQITIQNIHIRFENQTKTVKNSFSFGIQLQEILIYTADIQWQKQFIDRSDTQTQDQSLNKRIILTKLGVYWRSNEHEFYSNSQNTKIQVEAMQSFITNSNQIQFLLQISAEANVTQNQKVQIVPQYIIQTQLETINVNVVHNQLQDLIKLLEFFSAYSSYQKFHEDKIKYRLLRPINRFEDARIQDKAQIIREWWQFAIRCVIRDQRLGQGIKNAFYVSIEKRIKFQKTFNLLYGKILRASSQNYNIDILEISEIKEFQRILETIPNRDLQIWTLELVKSIAIEKVINETEKQKQKGTLSTIWGYLSGQQDETHQDNVITEEEKQEISKAIMNSFSDNNLNLEQPEIIFEADDSRVWLTSNIKLKGFRLCLQNKQQDIKQGIRASFNEFDTEINLMKKSRVIKLSLTDYFVELLTFRQNGEQEETHKILYRRSYYQQNLLNLEIQLNPVNRIEDQILKIDIGSIEFVYNPVIIKILTTFFDIKTEDENLKAAAWDQVDKLATTTKDTIKQILSTSLKKRLEVKIISPFIILPFKQNFDEMSECWVIKTGDILAKTIEQQDISISDETLNNQAYEQYLLILNKTNLAYYPSIKALRSDEVKGIFNLLNETQLTVGLYMLKSDLKSVLEEKPETIISAQIAQIKFNLSKGIYDKLLKIEDYLTEQEDQEIQQDQQSEQQKKIQLIKSSYKFGELYKRGTSYKNWNKYFVIFAGSYLYLYNNQNDIEYVNSVYIKGSELVVVVPDSEREFSFKLVNKKNKEYLFAATNQKMYKEWTDIINQKLIEQLQTDYTQDVSVARGEIQQMKKIQINSKSIDIKLQIEITQFEFSIRDQDFAEPWLLVKTEEFKFDLKKRPFDLEVIMLLNIFNLKDCLNSWNQSQKQLENIISSNTQWSGKEATKNQLIKISVIMIDPKHPNYDKKDLNVDIEFGSLFINFKPKSLIYLIQFFTNAKPSPQKPKTSNVQGQIPQSIMLPPIKSSDTIQYKERKLQKKVAGQTETLIAQRDHIILSFQFRLNEISITLIHRQTNILLSEISLKESKITIEQRIDKIELSGQLGNLQLFDLTNFPETINSNTEFNKIVPKELIGVGLEQKSLLNVNAVFYDTEQLDMTNKNKSSVNVKISSIQIQYYQQPILRLVDYLLEQVIVLTDPKILNRNPEDTTFQTEPTEDLLQEAQQQLINPLYNDIYIDISTPIIILKPTPSVNEYFEIQLGRITICNKQGADKQRVIQQGQPLYQDLPFLESVPIESYLINFYDMGIKVIRGKRQFKITNPIRFNLQVDRPSIIELPYLYKDLEIVTNMNIVARLQPIMLNISKADYILLMKIINFNIQFNDSHDKLFIFNYENIQNSNKQEMPISLKFDIDGLAIFCLEKELQFISVRFQAFRLIYERDQKANQKIYVFGKVFKATVFEEYKRDPKYLLEKGLINHLGRNLLLEKQSINSTTLYQLLEKDAYQIKFSTHIFSQYNEYSFEEYNEKDVQFKLTVLMQQNEPMEVFVVLSSLNINLQTGPLLSLIDFTELDESVTPQPKVGNIHEKESIERYQGGEGINKQQKQIAEDLQIGEPITFSLQLKNVIISIPTGQKQVFAAQGNISMILARYEPKTIQQYINEVQSNNLTLEKAIDLNQVQKMTIHLQDFQIFRCSAVPLYLKQFEEVKKRKIIQPFTFFVMCNDILIPDIELKYFSKYKKIDGDLNNFSIRLNYSDLLLLQLAVEWHRSFLDPEKSQKLQEEKQKAEQKLKDYNKLVEETQKKIEKKGINQLSAKINFSGLQLTIINDIGDIFIPVMELLLTEIDFFMTQKENQIKLCASLSIKATYYNLFISRWEPFIEDSSLTATIINNIDQNPRTLIQIELNKNTPVINLNISKEFILVLLRTQTKWKNDSQKMQEQLTCDIENDRLDLQQEFQEDLIYQVSLYKISNFTGYDLEIQRDYDDDNDESNSNNNIVIYKLQNNKSLNYSIENNLDIFNQNPNPELKHKILIKILHPNSEFNIIRKLNLGKVTNILHRISRSSNQMDVSLLSQVTIEDYSRKTLIISSDIKFQNNTDQVLKLMLFGKSDFLTLTIQPYSSSYIPLDHTKSILQIQYIDSEIPSCELDLNYYSKKPDNSSYEIKHGTYYSILRIQKNENGGPRIITFHIDCPLIIKNCLPFQLFYQVSSESFKDTLTGILKPQQQFLHNKTSITQNVFLKLRAQKFLWSDHIKISRSSIEAPETIPIKDKKNRINYLYLKGIQSHTSRRFVIYSKICFINESPFDLSFYSADKDQISKISGQKTIFNEEVLTPIVLMPEAEYFVVASSDTTYSKSKKHSLKQFGTSILKIIHPTQNNNCECIECAVNIQTIQVDEEAEVYTKIIVLSPRIVFVNKTGYLIRLRQTNQEQHYQDLPQNYHQAFIWYDYTQPQRIQVKPILEDQFDWNWSGSLQVSEVGSVPFITTKSNKVEERMNFILNVNEDNGQLIVVLEQQKDYCIYQISNNTEKCRLNIFQTSRPDIQWILQPGDITQFAWPEPDQVRQITVLFQYINDNHYENITETFNFNDINIIKKMTMNYKNSKQGQSYVIKSKITTDKQTRILHIEEAAQLKIQKQKQRKVKKNKQLNKQTIQEILQNQLPSNEDIVKLQVIMQIDALGISIIGTNTNTKERLEIFYIYLQKLELALTQTSDRRILQTRCKFINIDNNALFITYYPVLVCPRDFGVDNTKDNEFTFNLVLDQNLQSQEVLHFYQIKCELAPLSIQVEEGLINILFNIEQEIEQVTEDYKGKQGTQSSQQYFRLNKCNLIESNIQQQIKPDWQTAEYHRYQSNYIYINQLGVLPFKFNISFQRHNVEQNGQQQKQGFFSVIINAFGFALSNIDEAPISLKTPQINNIYDTLPGISYKFIKYYIDQLKRQIVQIIGSANIIGNPVGFFRNISTGVEDFFEKPAQGFIKGPLEGGAGVILGTGSLIKNTVSGTFDSINRFTGSVATGLSTLTMDDEYLRQRERMKMKKPKHVLEGIGQGTKSIYQGIEKGLTGIFLKPIQGASRSGIKGFFKGTIQGITGLVVKPVTGILDATSKTAEGITRILDKGQQINQKIRKPRAFYRREQFIKTYDDLDAEIYTLLKLYKNGRYSNDYYCSAFEIVDRYSHKIYYLVLTLEHIVYLNYDKGKADWDIQTNNIKEINLFKNENILIIMKNSTKKLKNAQTFISVTDPNYAMFIFKEFKNLKDQLKD